MNDAYVDVDGGDGRPARGREGRRSPASSSPRAKKTFFAGGDLNDLIAGRPRRTPPTMFADGREASRRSCAGWRRSASPVVAAINGAALGGGLEIALACHHRIVVDDPKVELGLPEVTLGLLPGGGGVVRTVRMLGISRRADGRAAAGHSGFKPGAGARSWASSTSSSPTRDELVPAAKAWIAAQPRRRGRAAVGRQGLQDPRRHAVEPEARAACRRSRPTCASSSRARTTRPRTHILAAAVEGAQVDFDTALAIEARYFVDLVDRPGREEHDPGVLLRPAGDQRRRAAARGHRRRSRRTRSSCSAPG